MTKNAPTIPKPWSGDLPEPPDAALLKKLHPKPRRSIKTRGQTPFLFRKLDPKKEPQMDTQQDDTTKKTRKPGTPDPTGAKTIGVKVPPDLYAALDELRKHESLSTMKDALLLAACRGVRIR